MESGFFAEKGDQEESSKVLTIDMQSSSMDDRTGVDGVVEGLSGAPRYSEDRG